MHCIPRELWPSSLLWLDDGGPYVDRVKGECTQAACPLSLTSLEAWKNRADTLLAQGKDNCCALILVFLSDQYRALDMPGKALECSQDAECYLTQWNRPEHRHNHAIVHYSLGLIYQDMGSEMDAQTHFEEALAILQATKVQWLLLNDVTWQKHCDEAMRWIRQAMKRLFTEPPQSPASEPQVAVPVMGRIAAGEPMLASEQFEEWIRVGVSRARRVSFALRVRGESMIDDGILPGSLVLVEQNESPPPNGTTVAIFVERREAEATLKKFYQEDDHIRLEPANASEPLRILKADSAPEDPIRAWYAGRNPGRKVEFYPVVGARIVGWVRGVLPG